MKLPAGFDSVMVTILDDDITSEVRITSQEEVNDTAFVDSEDDGDHHATPASFAQYYVVFETERVMPAYRVDFHLDEKLDLPVGGARSKA